MAELDKRMIPVVSSSFGIDFFKPAFSLVKCFLMLFLSLALRPGVAVGIRQSQPTNDSRGRPLRSRSATMYRAASMLWSFSFSGSSFSPPLLPGFTAHT